MSMFNLNIQAIITCLYRTRAKNYIEYDLSDTKKLEENIVRDVISGLLRFRTFTDTTLVSIDTHHDCINCNIKLRIDSANIGGTFTFLYIQDRDYSFGREGFNFYRVVNAIVNKEDRSVDRRDFHDRLMNV